MSSGSSFSAAWVWLSVLILVILNLGGAGQLFALTEFSVGEKMEFAITFQGLLVGHGYLEVCAKETFNDREVYHLVSIAQTEDFFSSFFYLKDRVDTLVTTDSLETIAYEKSAHEGNNYEYIQVVYDHQENIASVDGESYRIVPGSRDILGSFYYLRTISLSVGDSFVLPIYQGERNASLYIDVIANETIDTIAGTFDTLVIEGRMEGTDGLFSDSSEFKLWLTNNDKRYVTRIQTSIVIGTISIDLINIE